MSDRDLFTTTARLHVRATTAELITLGKGRAPDPAIFEERTPFFWLNEISSDRLDSYFTRMDPATTLVNFAREAAEGRAFLAGHRHWELPFGYTLTGQLETAAEATRVVANAYTLRGLELGGVKTDSFIDGARAGLIRDTSVGFNLGADGWYRCDVCGNNMRDWRACPHIPGLTYEEVGAANVVRQVLATATVVDGHLNEVSAVYDGATPSAGILKAQEGARAGHIDDRQVRQIEASYRMHLPDRRFLVPGVSIPPAAAPTSDPQEAAGDRAAPEPQELPMPVIADLRALLGLAESDADETLVERVRALTPPAELGATVRALAALPADAPDAEALTAARQIAAELPALREQAELGRQYREELVNEAVADAVRALGAEHEATNRAALANLPIAGIRQMRDAWRAIGDARFPGGRQTTDEPPASPAPAGEPEGERATPATPAAAFRA